MKGVLVSKTTRELKEFPTPQPGLGEILIKSERALAFSSHPASSSPQLTSELSVAFVCTIRRRRFQQPQGLVRLVPTVRHRDDALTPLLVDRKIPTWIEGYEAIEGNDVAGYVEKLGKGVTRFQVGDKVGTAAFELRRRRGLRVKTD